MEITLEQIDLIMQRANVSYAEAKAALEQANGDILEALLLLEQGEKIKSNYTTTQNSCSTNSDKIKNFINKLNATNFIMKKKEHTYVDVPLSFALIFLILSFHISIVAIIVSLVLGVRIHIQGDNDLASKINSTFDEFKR
ncbi:DUF4342 domain-containing protein [Cellulosilyticum ruminicola]|uniref:DUF4342 domain-containing protein n=1 Tax=Cellulosilyticum ruminicola TaxID=425254 RepID=UPI0006D0D3AD|nr:DUF4342 domain-containing protein [Cellulosilyticum ruminicola]